MLSDGFLYQSSVVSVQKCCEIDFLVSSLTVTLDYTQISTLEQTFSRKRITKFRSFKIKVFILWYCDNSTIWRDALLIQVWFKIYYFIVLNTVLYVYIGNYSINFTCGSYKVLLYSYVRKSRIWPCILQRFERGTLIVSSSVVRNCIMPPSSKIVSRSSSSASILKRRIKKVRILTA